MKTTRDLIVDAIALLIYLVAANPAITGLPIHEWVSIGVLVAMLVHMVLHWDWTLDAVRRLRSRLQAASKWNLAIDVALFIAFMTCFVSGVMVSRHVLVLFGYFGPGYFVWNPIHSISAVVLLALLMLHTVVHWKWIVTAVRRRAVRA